MARVGFFADQGAKNGSSKGSPYLGEDRLGNYEGKENKPQCHFPLSRQGRHMLTVGREGLCPGNYVSVECEFTSSAQGRKIQGYQQTHTTPGQDLEIGQDPQK